MKICLFSNFLPGVGGIERASHTLAEGWRGMGHTVTIATATPRGEFDDAGLGMDVFRPPLDRFWRDALPAFDILVSNGLSLRHVREWRRSGVPFGWIHGMAVGGYETLSNIFQLHLRRAASRMGHFNICVSHAMKRHIRNPRALVIYNPIDPLFRPLPDVPPSGRFLFYGRMWTPKGMDVLLQAIAQARTQGIVLPTDFVGEGEALAATQALARDLHLGDDIVRFLPFQQGDALVRTINAARAVVVPSRCPEAFGLVAVEAMACGKCVIGSRAGGLSEILEGYAPTFAVGDSSELATLLMELHRHPERLRAYEQSSLRRAADFQLRDICQRYLHVFEGVVAKSRRRRVST